MSDTMVLAQREQLVLSSILFDKECREWAVYKGLNPRLFQDKLVHRMVRAFVGVSEDGTAPSEALLLDQLAGSDSVKRKQWKEFLIRLEKEVPPENKEALEIHISKLRDANEVRQYGAIAQEVLNLVNGHDPLNPSMEKDKIKYFVENSFFELDDEHTEEQKQMNLSEGIHYTVQKMKEALVSDNSESVSSGYDELDNALVGGFKKGTFAMIAARPGMGKTVWMLNSALESARAGNKVLFISIEMSLLQCFQRLLAKIADVSGKKIQQPERMLPNDWANIADASKEIVEMVSDNFWVQEITEITAPQLERIIKHYKKKYDIDAVYIDYAQIMLTKEGNEPKEASDFAQISGGLRRAAKKHNVAVIVGSQLNREVEKRNDKRPIMADIRNSGAFEQDAAVIIALYRDEVYNEASEDAGTIELIFLKNRFGKNGIKLKFNYDLDKQAIYSEAVEAA